MTPEVDPGLRVVFKERHTQNIVHMKRVRTSLTRPRSCSSLAVQVLCSTLLLPTLEIELEYMQQKHVFRRREVKVRATCGATKLRTYGLDDAQSPPDRCDTQLFGSSLLCKVCAAEFCFLCFPPKTSDMNTVSTYVMQFLRRPKQCSIRHLLGCVMTGRSSCFVVDSTRKYSRTW